MAPATGVDGFPLPTSTSKPPSGKFGPPFIPTDPVPEGMVMGMMGPFSADYSTLPYNGHMILGVITFLSGLSILVVCTRIYVRHFVLKAFGWDDGIMCWAMLHSIALIVCTAGQVANGAGRHWYHIQIPEEYGKWKEWQLGQIAFAVLGVSVVKISVGFSMLRFLVGKKTRYFTYFLMGWVVVATATTFGPFFADCTPLSSGWAYQRDPTKCMNPLVFKGFADANGIMNIVTDFMFVLLPIPTIWKLQVNRRTKISLMFVLSLGAVVGFTAIARMLDGIKPGPGAMVLYDSSWDIPFFLWGSAELNAGIIAASLPPLRPLAAKFLGDIEKRTQRFRTGGSRNQYGISSGSNLNSSSLGNKGWQRQHDDVPLGSTKDWHSATITSPRRNKEGDLEDNSSEEAIFSTSNKPKAVMRTTEIHVQEHKL